MRQGAFTTQQVSQDLGPTDGPDDFLARLQGVAPPPVSRETPSQMDGLASLARMTQSAPAVAGRIDRPSQETARPAPPVELPEAVPPSFVLGKPGAPKSGMTIHQIMRDPDVLTTVQKVVAEFERSNPGRSLKGTHIQAGLGANGLDVSSAQAAKLAKRIKDEADKMVRQQVASYSGRAAKKVMG
jgi:hypothetical protein